MWTRLASVVTYYQVPRTIRAQFFGAVRCLGLWTVGPLRENVEGRGFVGGDLGGRVGITRVVMVVGAFTAWFLR